MLLIVLLRADLLTDPKTCQLVVEECNRALVQQQTTLFHEESKAYRQVGS